MYIKNKIIFTMLLGLLSAGALMAGCSQSETRDDAEASDAPTQVVRGEGTGAFAEIAIPAASMFGFDKVELNEDGKAAIEEFRKSQGPEFTEAYKILIVGHTDTSGDAGYNKVLSLKRAQSVADYLTSTGVDADKLRVVGRGSREPVASNETLEGRVQNRRVDILVIAEFRALDTILFPSVALFERKSADLTESGRALLDEKRKEARELLSRASYIEIVGHTDDKGDANDNMVLSKLRAASVRDHLAGQGLDGSKIFTSGMGETMPIASNDTEEGRAQNRRVQILILGRVKD